MNYTQIVARALAISWRHKYLWLLALLAGEATTIGLNFGGGSGRRGAHGEASTPVTWAQVTEWVSTHYALLWSAGVTLALLGAVLFLLSAIANGALVRASAEHDAERPFGLRQAWTAGVRSFWPVLGLKFFALIVGASLAIVLGGLGLITVVLGTGGATAAAIATGALTGLLLVAAIPLLVVFGVAVALGVRAIVLDGRGASDGLRAALRLIWRRRGRVALVWLLVSIAGMVASAVVGLAMVVAALPIIVLTAGAYLAGGWLAAAATGVGLGTAWLIVVITFVGGVKAFTSTCWTVAYPRFGLQPEPAVEAQPQPA